MSYAEEKFVRRTEAVRGKRGGTIRNDRIGKRLLAAHVPEDVARQIKMLAAENLTTTSSLLTKAISLLFKDLGKPLPSSLSDDTQHK